MFWVTLCSCEVTIDDGPDGFSLSFNGILLLEHTPEKPLFTVGAGSFEAKIIQGNYEITDDITESYPLTNWNIGMVLNNLTIISICKTITSILSSLQRPNRNTYPSVE